MQFSETELLSFIARFIWSFLRIGALFVTLPIFSSHSVPVRLRLILALALTFLVLPLLPPAPSVGLFSYQGLMIGVQQVFIGLLAGFVLQLVFAAIIFGGQSIAYSMGLGFAALVDPQTGVQVPVISQFYLILATLVFLALDGHLLLIKMLTDSFQTIPIALDGIGKAGLWALIAWSGRLFAGGVLLALPVMVTLLLVNIGFGVATRAAPQLNIFSVGFPVTLLLGLLLIWITLPPVIDQFSALLGDGYGLIGQILHL